MFQFPRFPPTPLYIQGEVLQLLCSGFPHSDIYGSTLGRQLPVAFRSHPRPSSASGAKASTVGSLLLGELLFDARARYADVKVNHHSE